MTVTTMIRCGLVLAAILASPGADAQTVGRFQDAFNAAARRIGTSARIAFVQCEGEPAYQCIYSAPPATRIEAAGDRRDGPVEDLAVYLPPERRAGFDATSLLGTLIATFSPQLSKSERGGVLMQLMEGAAGPDRGGDVAVKGVVYSLRPNDGRGVRVYIRRK